jgi:hypothetical protein
LNESFLNVVIVTGDGGGGGSSSSSSSSIVVVVVVVAAAADDPVELIAFLRGIPSGVRYRRFKCQPEIRLS